MKNTLYKALDRGLEFIQSKTPNGYPNSWPSIVPLLVTIVALLLAVLTGARFFAYLGVLSFLFAGIVMAANEPEIRAKIKSKVQ